METPFSLLKQAIYENDPRIQTESVSKACKMITDILSLPQRSQTLLENPELIKFLMISLPLNPRSIEWLITSMIDKFKYERNFLKPLWQAFVAVASFTEAQASEKKKVIQPQLGMRRMVSSISYKKANISTEAPEPIKESNIPGEVSNWRPEDFCFGITENREMIKNACIEHVKKFMDIYFKDLKDVLRFKPDFFSLLKKFLRNAEEGETIMKIVKAFEKLMKYDPTVKFDHEIEEVFVNKKDIIFQYNAKPETTAPGIKRAQTIAIDPKLGSNSFVNRLDANPSTVQPLSHRGRKPKAEVIKRCKSFAAPVSKPEIEKEIDSATRRQIESEQMEKWLTECRIDEVPVVANAKRVKQLLQTNNNFEAFLTYVFNANDQPLSTYWEQKFPSIHLNTEEDDNLTMSFAKISPQKAQNSGSRREMHFYTLRSFKAVQTLCDEANYKSIFGANKEALDIYFYHAYSALNIKEDSLYNLNHIGLLTETLARREPEGCVGYILHYNLLYKMIQHIESPYILKLLTTLFRSSEHANDVSPDAYSKLLHYCELVSFFPDFGQALLEGWSNFESNKYNEEYKPPGVEQLVSVALEYSNGKEGPSGGYMCSSHISYDIKESVVFEDSGDYHLDVDRIQPILKNKPVIDKEKLIKSSRSSGSGKKQQKHHKYPSLKDLNTSEKEAVAFEDFQSDTNNSIDDIIDKELTTPKRTSITSSGQKSRYPGAKSLQNIGASTPRGPSVGSLNKLDDVKPPKSRSRQIASMTNTDKIVKKAAKPAYEGIMKKEGKYSRTNLDEEVPVKSLKTVVEEPSRGVHSVKFAIQTPQEMTIIKKAPNMRPRNMKPVKRALHKEFDVEVLDKALIEELDRLYPMPLTAKNEIEKEADQDDYSTQNLRLNDGFSLALCEFLEIVVKKAVVKSPNFKKVDEKFVSIIGNMNMSTPNLEAMKERYELNKKLGKTGDDFSHFWRAFFGSDCALFENLFKNYLFKIKIHHVEHTNSGHVAGTIVNLILDECVKGNPDFDPYVENILAISKKYFPFLCRTIVQSYAWIPRDDQKIYLQDCEVKNPLGSGRILLATTLKLIIENDFSDNYKITRTINDTCWHVLMLWFSTHRTNNAYQQIFYLILQITFLHNPEEVITNLLVKLGLIPNLYKTWSEICPHGMLRKDLHYESLFNFIKRIVFLVEFIAQENEGYKILKRELKRSISWEILRNALFINSTESKMNSRSVSKAGMTTSSAFIPRRSREDFGTTGFTMGTDLMGMVTESAVGEYNILASRLN